MTRLLTEPKLLIATHNHGKIREFQTLLRPYGLEVTDASAHDLNPPEETGTSFAENAALKAVAAAKATGLPALADDSGLTVTALEGAPGIYSARWAGPGGDFNLAMQHVEQALQQGNHTDRGACFVCVLALAWPDGHITYGTGECRGTLIWPPRGQGGFGYDAIFVPEGEERSFGELSREEKQAYSHRAAAFESLREQCL